jgi:hypothetical protein
MDILAFDVQFREYQQNQQARYINIDVGDHNQLDVEDHIQIDVGDHIQVEEEKQKKPRKCSACGEFGHNRSNKLCSKYSETIEKRKKKREREAAEEEIEAVVAAGEDQGEELVGETGEFNNLEDGDDVYFDEMKADDVFVAHNQTNTCLICLEGFNVGASVIRMNCMCLYHSACIYSWWAKKKELLCVVPHRTT